MNLHDLAHQINARICLDTGSACQGIETVHASDTMSDLIAHAANDTLLVTSLNNNQLVRVAELMDVPGICLVGMADPGPELLAMARSTGTAIMISPHDREKTCRLLEACLGGHSVTRE